MSAQEVLAEVMRDKAFYDNSGGGVTVSGGEPLMHTDFCCALLKMAKEKGISTACETSGFGKWENVERFAECVDIFLWDYKETSPALHREFTGVDNALILENLGKLDALGAKIVLRCPIIPGLNDREEHFAGIADVANKHASVLRVEIEPYHSLGKGKALAIGKDYPLADLKSVSKADAKVWVEAISKYTDKEVIVS
jgi:pyruvate formate lyase activating enzyme